MTAQTYQYICDRSSYRDRPVPSVPGMVEHMFYCKARNIPHGVPSKCNPRNQNIDKAVYQKVTDSFLDLKDPTFHIKNKGITVLATRVKVRHEGTQTIMDVEIPDNLGDVDGHHTYKIADKYREDNPDQSISIRILEGMPMQNINPVAEGLNTCLQVTAASLADHLDFFEPVKKKLEGTIYEDRIGWKDNQPNCSAINKDIVTLMWICNPILFEGKSSRAPNWTQTTPGRVYDGGFYNRKNDVLREEMLRMSEVVPDLIDILVHLNNLAPTLIPKKQKKMRTRNPEATPNRPFELNLGNLMVKGRPPFTDPNIHISVARKVHLRDSYMQIILTGLRSLLRLNPVTNQMEWVEPDRDILFQMIEEATKRILKALVAQLKADRGNHNKTPKSPCLWTLSANEMDKEYYSRKEALATRMTLPPL